MRWERGNGNVARFLQHKMVSSYLKVNFESYLKVDFDKLKEIHCKP